MKKIILIYLLLISTRLDAQWAQMNGPNVGAIRCILSNGADVFASVNYHGSICFIFHSVDSGLTWKDASIDKLSHLIDAAALARSGTNIFAGTYGYGVYFSSDNGNSWTQVNNGLGSPHIYALAASGTNIFASSSGQVYLSTNNGSSWSWASNGLGIGFVKTLATNGANIFAGTYNGAFLSANNGGNWLPINNGLGSANINAFAFSGTNIFVGTNNNGIYLSANNGSNWTWLGAPMVKVTSLVVSGTDIFAGSKNNGIFLSSDTGVTWTVVNSGLKNHFVNSLETDGSKIFSGTEGGFFTSVNNGNNWVLTGCPSLAVRMFAQMGTNLFCGGTNTGSNSGGYQNDGVFLSTDSGLNWALKRNGLPLDNVNVQALAVKGTDIFAGIWGRGVFLSMDTGNTWTAVNNGIADSNIYSIVINGNNIFAGAGDFAAGTGAIFLSSNNGTSWTDITPGLSSLRVWKLFAFGTDIFASTANGLYFSSDTGNTWSLRDNGLPGIDIINCFASNGSDIYVGTGFGSGAGVYFSADTGMNWVAVNNGLPVSPFVSSLCISNGNIFAGIPHFPGTNGVYLSTDNGNSWSDVNTGLTERSVSSLHVIGNDILAGTYSSVFRRSISEILSAVEIKEPYEHNSDCVIYPNPARDYFVVQFKAAIKNASVEIYNLMGEKLYMESLVNTIMSKINCKIISPGIYLVRVRDGEKQYCRKLFIEHD